MIDSTCRIIGDGLSCGSHSRIDAFCLITGRVEIGRRVHVAGRVTLIGSGGTIRLQDGSAVSHGTVILTASDSYVEGYAIGPGFPDDMRSVQTGDVTLMPMSCCGAQSTIMPGCRIGFGARLGAHSFLTRDIPDGEIWGGVPARKIGEVRDLWRLRQFAEELFA